MSHIKVIGIDERWARIAERLMRGEKVGEETEIYSGRNRILRIKIGEDMVAVKFFSRSLKNRLIYSVFSSKAERSYLYALELTKRGIRTPEPLAYAERRGVANTLQDSLYICRYEEAEDLRDYLDEGDEAWKSFARFAAELHAKGILHRDLNNTNVRINRQPDGIPLFSLIDLNRIKFVPDGAHLSLKEKASNLVRFSYYTPEFDTFAREYVSAAGLPASAAETLITVKQRHERHTKKHHK